MTKTELVKILAERIGPIVSVADIERIIDGAISIIMDSLKRGDYVQIRGFGTFRVVKRKARIARNPKKGEIVPLEDRYVPDFKPTREFKQMVIESLRHKILEEKGIQGSSSGSSVEGESNV
ncbi:DNA-binding protein HU-beta [Candidatus Thermokryptus mobilis]|uniref:DNA-binding protein HU-beta n=1 Tax=Candidatus Thermokryptus mobilis TaxID=1643428 RepID=A0A0S4N5N1_9BACT|nr:HU family DNA-binding protein [Candidatus Thermokryptus mobilis]CUU05329.1 DNA-binding protein HU-beta [Candidatus Thermokryptus mobilis]